MLKLIKTCRRTAYPTLKRAQEVLWIMTTKGVDTRLLRAYQCSECRQFHIKYITS